MYSEDRSGRGASAGLVVVAVVVVVAVRSATAWATAGGDWPSGPVLPPSIYGDVINALLLLWSKWG